MISYRTVSCHHYLLIFMNDLEDEISSNVLKFADNTKIFRELKDNKDCSGLQSELDKLVFWSQKWQIEYNVIHSENRLLVGTVTVFTSLV